ncbi:MAG TPA: efflux RND transporter permease subunit, partial [Limnochordia bacterium]
PAGQLVDSGTLYDVRVGSRFDSIEAIERLVVGQRQPPAAYGFAALAPPLLRVSDVAEVIDTYRLPTGRIRVDRQPAIIVQLFKQPDADTVSIAAAARATLEAFAAARPALQVDLVTDQSSFIHRSIAEIAQAGLIGGLLAVGVLYAFMPHIGLVLLLALSLPLSIAAALLPMYLGGLTLNVMSLAGLALAAGMLVDNGIVALESIGRFREEGRTPLEAAAEGTRTVGGAITASTLTSIVIFAPIVFMRSAIGSMFWQLGAAISLTLLASLFVALCVLPPLASRLPAAPSPRALFQRFLDRYRCALAGALRRPWWPVIGVLACAGAALGAMRTLEIGLFPDVPTDRVSVDVALPPGTSLADADRIARAAEGALSPIEGIERIVTQVGRPATADVLGLTAQLGGPQPAVQLDLRFSSPAVASARLEPVRQALERAFRPIPGDIRVRVKPVGALPETLSSGTLQIELSGPSRAVLNEQLQALVSRLANDPAFSDLELPSAQRPELRFEVDRTRGLIGGVTVGQIGLALRAALGGSVVTHLELDGEQVPVVVRPRSDEIDSLPALLELPIPALTAAGGTAGGSVRLEKVAAAIPSEAPGELFRINHRPTLRLFADVGAVGLGRAIERLNAHVSALSLPPGYTVDVRGAYPLIAEAQAELRAAAALAVFLVYALMAVLFESLSQPLIILATVPLAALGGLGALWLCGQHLGVPGLIGLIVLIGIAVNNGIVLIDQINQLRRQGVPLHGAIVEGAARRVRPVLMTSLTTVLGALPMAFGWGDGAKLQQPLAIAVIGGLAFATIVTLIVVPSLYALATGHPDRLGRSAGANSWEPGR